MIQISKGFIRQSNLYSLGLMHDECFRTTPEGRAYEINKDLGKVLVIKTLAMSALEIFDQYKDIGYFFLFTHSPVCLFVLAASITWPFGIFIGIGWGKFTFSFGNKYLYFRVRCIYLFQIIHIFIADKFNFYPGSCLLAFF